MYELIVSGQVSIGGPLVMLMCSVYIWYELGWLPLIGLSVFVVSYPLQVSALLWIHFKFLWQYESGNIFCSSQYFLAKGSGAMRRKAVRVKDERVSLISQVVQHFKFLKMFAWESYLYDTISGKGWYWKLIFIVYTLAPWSWIWIWLNFLRLRSCTRKGTQISGERAATTKF